MKRIGISQIRCISSLGQGEEVWENYKKGSPFLNGLKESSAVFLQNKLKSKISDFVNSRKDLLKLDPSVHYLLYLTQGLVLTPGAQTGINIASSRGATHLFEDYFDQFRSEEQTAVLSSPTTTLGNLSSWMAHELGLNGFEMSHSITCSSGLHALVNGVIWLESGRSSEFVIGASEASNTPFTIAQMSALKICQYNSDDDLPIRAMDFEKSKNTMAVSEGAGIAVLTSDLTRCEFYISGVGYATEKVEHPAAISANGSSFQKAMKMALKDAKLENVDAIVMHAPGTVKGDLSELFAIEQVFGDEIPALTNNKWIIGHTLGASGLHSLEMATLMLKHQEFIENPLYPQKGPGRLEHIMVNAVGFGGNAVSVIISR
ncbi:MAG: beta-ketoacyl synthase N-terminal-like domain-containing protein [Flavobacteriaceae bacterium]